MFDRDNELRRLGKTLIQTMFWLLLGGTLAYAEADWHKQSPIPGPGNTIVATAVTPDGSHAATVTDDGHISLWDLPNRKLIRSKHLPQGTPHHLAIRNQADAIAVAYEDADTAIWWCDGSDKVTSLNAKARLVAFANQARKLVTVYRRGEVWDIDTGEFLLSSNHTNLGNSLPYLSVLPSDRGAILYGTRFYDGTGFTLDKPGGIAVDWFSYVDNTQDTPLYSKQGQIETHYFDTSKIRFVARDIQGNKQFVERGITDMFAPVNIIEILPTHTNAIITYKSTYQYIPVLINGELSHLLSGTGNGGIIIFKKAKPNDWLSFPVSWLLVIFGAAFISQIAKALIAISRNRKPHPNPEDQALPLPTSTRWACYVIAVVGGLTIAGMISGLFFDSFNLNFMFLLLPAGIIVIKRKSNGWRKPLDAKD